MAEQTATRTGTFVWNEVMSKDIQRAKAFYTNLFGWTTREMDMGPAGKYTLWVNSDGKDVGGGMQNTPSMGDAPSHWMAYVEVANTDDTAAKATTIGGKVIVPPTEIPGVGRFAIIQDPTGATIGIHTAKA